MTNNNINDIINYLSRAFRETTTHSTTLGTSATRTVNISTGEVEKSKLYELQVDFAYLLNDIKNCPEYRVQKCTYVANEFINKIKKL